MPPDYFDDHHETGYQIHTLVALTDLLDDLVTGISKDDPYFSKITALAYVIAERMKQLPALHEAEFDRVAAFMKEREVAS